jgi:dethiobiotin synthetase
LNTLLIAGTDAQVGKTIVMMALIAYWQRYYSPHRLGVMKPIESHGPMPENAERDCDLLTRLFNLDQSPSEVTQVHLQATLPPVALDRQGGRIDLEQIWQQLQQLQQRDFVLLEAWGGLGSPLTPRTTVADLAWDWKLPTILVVPVQPGTVPHAVANVALARQARVHLKGIILNAAEPCGPEAWTDWAAIDLIQSLTQKPVLGCIPYLEDPLDRDKLVQIASDLDLERLLPMLEG